jgi:TonB family protein
MTVLGFLSAPLFAGTPLEIVSPGNGTVFRPGETVTITVRTTRRYTEVALIPAVPLQGFQALSTEPYSFSFPLSSDLAAGIYSFTVIGSPGSPGSVGFDASEPVAIDVEPIWPASADGSRLVHDSRGVTVDTFGIPLRHRSAVSYPPEALAHRIDGTVVVEITPNWEGRTEGVNVVSGPAELAKHVIRSVSTWHYAEGVGDSKPRRVVITFNLAQGLSPRFSDGGADPALIDNLSYQFWVSAGSRSLRFELKKLAIVGLSEDETRKLMAFFRTGKIQEGDEITFDQLYQLRSIARSGDDHLRTYFLRDAAGISATIAPVGLVAGDLGDEPPIQTERVPPRVAPGRIFVSAAEQARRLISKVEPEYPWLAKANHIQGVVRVRIIIGTDGRVLNLEVTSGHPLLCDAAREAVEQWVYSPAVVNGRAVEVITEAELEFYSIP